MTRTDLYRHYDKYGRLLYVGVSFGSIARLQQHKVTAHWVDDISRIDVSKFDSRDAALKAERLAIINEKPRHNVAFNKPVSLPVRRKMVDWLKYPKILKANILRLSSIITGNYASRKQLLKECKCGPHKAVFFSKDKISSPLADKKIVFDDPQRALKVCWPYDTIYLYKSRLPLSLRWKAYRSKINVQHMGQ